jgi:hypothetical protein
MLKPFFCNLNQKISPLSVQKNISDGVGSRNESIHTPLDPPLFWLDNIFKIKNLEYQEQKIFIFYFLVPKSSIHTGLGCVKKNSATKVSCLGPFMQLITFGMEQTSD